MQWPVIPHGLHRNISFRFFCFVFFSLYQVAVCCVVISVTLPAAFDHWEVKDYFIIYLPVFTCLCIFLFNPSVYMFGYLCLYICICLPTG